MVSKIFAALAAIAGVASAGANVAKFNAYWGQSGPSDERLRDRCDEGADYISLSFVTWSPENDPSGYPGIGFAAHCWAEGYKNDKGVESKLLSHCQTIKDDLQYCRDKGIKMLLSIGGVWNEKDSNYKVTTEDNGRFFGEFLWKAFGPYDPSWNGPRPFDKSPTEHSQIDGFDFDLEIPNDFNGNHFDAAPWVAMIEKMRSLSSDVIITGAPECPTAPQWFRMGDLIQKAQFDALFIQFYNNPGCDLIIGNDGSNPDDFNYLDWEQVIAKSDKSKNAKLFVGLPAAPNPKNSQDAYVRPGPLKHIICKIANRASFGGISLWDMYTGLTNVVDGKSYNQHIQEILLECGGTTTTTTSSVVTTTSSTTSSLPTSTSTSTSSTGSSSSSQTSQSGSSSTIPTVTSVSAPITTGPATTPISSVNSAPWSNSTITTAPEMTTSTVFTTTTYTITSCAPTVTNCPARVVTETIALYTTVCPVSKTNNPPKPTQTPSQVPPEMTTSTVYTTTTYTITKCPPAVTNCPVGKVTTETIPWYTTVCPVTKTNETPKPTQPAGQQPPSGNQPFGNQPSGNQPSGNQPSGNQPSGNQPSGNQPSGNQPSGNQPSGNQPSGNQPSGNQPSGNQPSGNQPSGNQPSGNQPSGAKPAKSMTTSTFESTATVVMTLTVPGPSRVETLVKPSVSPSQPAANKCPGGPNCPPERRPSGTGVVPTGSGAPTGPIGKPTAPPVTAGAASVAASMVALVAAQIFLL